MSSYDIQIISDEDLSEIEQIENSAHISPWSRSIFNSSLGKNSHNFLLKVDGIIAGYYFTRFIAGEMTLENICVSPDFQGQGIGSVLMAHLIELAKQLNSIDILLEVRQSNHAALALYKKHGFSIQGVRKGYYSLPNNAREDAILMNINSQS